MALPYHYALSFDYDQKLDLKLYFSVLFFRMYLQKKADQKLVCLKILGYKKEFKLNKLAEENSAAEFIQQKSKKFIQNKFKFFSDEDKSKDKEEKKLKKKKKKAVTAFPFSLISRENLSHFFQFIINLLKKLKPDYLKLDLLFSFADPYYNGIFLAYYYTFKELLDYPEINVKINWQEVLFKGKGAVGGRIIPLLILWHFFTFIFSFKTLKILWLFYKSK
jgi:hypothetical protein